MRQTEQRADPRDRSWQATAAVLGSLLVLTAFVAARRGSLTMASKLYLILDFVGASILTVLAAHARQHGFCAELSCL
jgi:hypothetical protein